MPITHKKMSNHLASEVAIVAGLCKPVEFHNVLFSCFSFLLSFENYVVANLEEVLECRDNVVVVPSLLCCDVHGDKYRLCLFTQAIEKGADLLLLCCLAQS